MAKREHWSKLLEEMGACDEAVQWCRKHKTVGEAWRKCSNSGWIEWLAYRLSPPNSNVVREMDHALNPLGGFWSANATSAQGKALLPTPTLADLKAAAQGEQPWELVK